MSKRTTVRLLSLLASTSAIAVAITVTPVTVDLNTGTPVVKAAHAESSCFIAGTSVLMADLTEKPIESVVVGDLVMGPDGTANRVIGIERPALGDRTLYGFADREPFVTAEHPFMTKQGWKAIDPDATAAENPQLVVGVLTERDSVALARIEAASATAGNLALAPAPSLELVHLAVGQIVARAADPATPLYNLLLDGDHAYFANGFLVHNKGDGGGGDGGGSGSGSGGGEGSGSGGGEGSGSGSGEGGEGGHGSSSSGEGGEGGEGGDDGHSGDDSGEAGEAGEHGEHSSSSAFGVVEQSGPDLSSSQEAEAISEGWQ